jgi:phosphopantothenoylcysteine decarboxylase/phosphopantothenate--cysteine ligase
LPVDVAVFAAAVADWRALDPPTTKIKKQEGVAPTLKLAENPDILATIARQTANRPALVIGFAAETGDVALKASAKRLRKGCDWIVANDVSPGSTVFGGTENTVLLIDDNGVEAWPTLSKQRVSEKLAERVSQYLLPA